MSEKYFVIQNTEGDTTVRVYYSKAELKEELPHLSYYGFITYEEIIKNPDTNYWNDGVLIIKGEIASPKPIEIITEWDV